jgi:hypothetical protein
MKKHQTRTGTIGVFVAALILALCVTVPAAAQEDEPGHCNGEYVQLMASIGSYDPITRNGQGTLLWAHYYAQWIVSTQARLDQAAEELCGMPDYGLEGMIDDVQDCLDQADSELGDAMAKIATAQAACAAGLTHILASDWNKAHVSWGAAEQSITAADGHLEACDMSCLDADNALEDLLEEIDNYKNPEDPDPEDPEDPEEPEE